MSPTLMAPDVTSARGSARVAPAGPRTARRHPADPRSHRGGRVAAVAPAAPAVRPSTARPHRRTPVSARPVGTPCRDGSGRGGTVRPAHVGWGAALLAGLALAVAVWAVVVGGSMITAEHTPDVVGSSVVHVRGGESLSALAARTVPDAPVSQVVADIRELNHLGGSALTPGQPLLAPRYAH